MNDSQRQYIKELMVADPSHTTGYCGEEAAAAFLSDIGFDELTLSERKHMANCIVESDF